MSRDLDFLDIVRRIEGNKKSQMFSLASQERTKHRIIDLENRTHCWRTMTNTPKRGISNQVGAERLGKLNQRSKRSLQETMV